MEFFGGMVVGLIIGVTVGVIAICALMLAKRNDPDYESIKNAPNAAGVDRQGRR